MQPKAPKPLEDIRDAAAFILDAVRDTIDNQVPALLREAGALLGALSGAAPVEAEFASRAIRPERPQIFLLGRRQGVRKLPRYNERRPGN